MEPGQESNISDQKQTLPLHIILVQASRAFVDLSLNPEHVVFFTDQGTFLLGVVWVCPFCSFATFAGDTKRGRRLKRLNHLSQEQQAYNEEMRY